METNYTLKKLIRGGTALLFLLTFMLAGAFSAIGNDKNTYPLYLKISGPGVVEISAIGINIGEVENKTEGIQTTLIGNVANGVNVFLNANPADCWKYDGWEASVGSVETTSQPGFDWVYHMVAEQVYLQVNFTQVFIDPEFAFADEACTNTPVQIAFDNPADLNFPLQAYVLRDGVTTTLDPIILEDENDFLVNEILPEGDYLFELESLTDVNGCIIEEPILIGNITVNPIPEPAITIDGEFCAFATITASAAGDNFGTDSEYLWTLEGETSNEVSPVFDGLAAGDYSITVQVTNTDTGCIGTADATFTVIPSPAPVITVDLEFCVGEAIMPTVSGPDFGTDPEYLWTLDGMTSDEAAPEFVGLDDGVYTLEVLVTNTETGCQGTAEVEITVHPSPVPEIIVELEFCADELIMPLVQGDLFGDNPTFEWTLDELTSTSETPVFGNLDAGIYTLEVAVTNTETGCVGTAAVDITINPLPDAEITGEEVVCFGEDAMLTLVDLSSTLGDDYSVSYYAQVEGYWTVYLGTVTNTTEFEFVADESIPGIERYVSKSINVWAHIENEWGCEDYSESFTFVVREKPHVVDNNIQKPQIGQNFKYIFCEMIPKETVFIHGIGVPVASDFCDPDPDQAIELRWRVRHYANGQWSGWITAPGISNNESYMLPEWNRDMYPGLEMVQYKRQARAVGCECGDGNNGTTAWADGNSNVITIYVVDHIEAKILEAGPVCYDDTNTMVIEGNLLSVPVMDDEGEPTGAHFTYVTGLWTTEEEGLEFGSAPNLAVNTLIADGPGMFMNAINWALTPVSVVYAECSSNNPLYCCSGDDVDETVIFEQLTVPAIEPIPNVVCLSNTQVKLPYVLTASGMLPSVSVDVYKDGEPLYSGINLNPNWLGEYIYNLPIGADGGQFTVNFTVALNECEEQRSVSFERIPHYVVAAWSYHCYEEGVEHEINYTPNGDDRYILQYSYRVNPPVLTGTAGYSAWVDAPDAEGLPTFEDPAVYQVRLRYRTEEPIACTGPETTIVLEVLPNITDIAFVDEACYDEDIQIEVTHSRLVTSMDLMITGETIPGYPNPWIINVPVNPNNTKTVYTFAPGQLRPGVHEFTATVYRQLPGGQEICEFTYSQELTVDPPVYAVFSPNYRKDVTGTIVYIEDVPNVPAQGFIGGIPYVLNLPVSIVNDGGLYIDFSAEVADLIGDPLSGEDQGEFVTLEKKVDGAWELVPVKVTYTEINLPPSAGYNAVKRATVRPYDFVNQKFLELEFETEYRLMHANVYKTSCGEGDLVEYRLSKIWDADLGEYVYNEINTFAYSKEHHTLPTGANKVYFKTFDVAYANLPSVFPIGDDGRCDEIVVEFKNPVRYRANQFITPDGSQFKYKFDLEKKAFGSGTWVTEDIIDYVQPENFVTVVGDVAGPTRMVIHLNDGVELDYGADYRIRMVPSIVGGQTVYGFWDLVLDVPVLDLEYNFNTYNNGIGTGWHWSTSQYYPVVYEFAGPDDEYGTRPDNHNNIEFSRLHPDVVTYPVINGEVGLNIQDDPYHVDFYGGSFNVTAVPGEGYRWVRWKRSANGGINWENLKTTNAGVDFPGYLNSNWYINGIDYFPQTFTWKPDTTTRGITTNIPPAKRGEKVWLFPGCDDDLIYAAEFEKKTYRVRGRPVADGGLIPNNDLGTVTVDNINVQANNRVHGSTVTLRATPKAGYYFVGWDLSQLHSGFTGEATEIYTPPAFENIMDPLDHTAVLELEMLGEMPQNTLLDVYAKFKVFNPKIHAAAQGLKYDGSVDANITNIQVTYIHVAENQIDVGLEQVHEFLYDDFNKYEWLQIKYGNPTYPAPPAVSEFSHVTLVPLNPDCEYEFDKWERFDWTVIGEDNDGPIYEGWREIDPVLDGITINEVNPALIQFIPTENYRLRAQFVWREDVDVDVVVYQNDTYTYGAGHEVEYGNATIEVKFIGPREDGTRADGSRDRWINGVPHPNNVYFTEPLSATQLLPHDLLEITVYPETNYYTYYWVDQNGNEIVSTECAMPLVSSITLIDRFSGGGTPDRSVWHYKVGCDDITLRAVLMLKRFEVGITATDMGGWPVRTGATQQGRFTNVGPLNHISMRKFNCDLGYVSGNSARRGLGFVQTAGVATRPAAYRGYFEKFVDGQNTYSDFTATAVGFYNSPANDEVWVFADWQERIGGIWVTISTEPVLNIDEIASGREFRARFNNIYEEPTYLLTVTDDIDDYTAPYTYEATWVSSLGHPYYYAYQASPVWKRNVVTLEKGFVAGYNFQTWVLQSGLVLNAPITLTDRNNFPELTAFINEVNAGLEEGEEITDAEIIELFLARETLQFRMPAQAVNILASYDKHVYTITPIVRTHRTPHTLSCLDIDDILGGNAEDITPAGTISYNYGEVVHLRGRANEGFTAINWMYGDINDCSEGGNNALTGWQFSANELTTFGFTSGWVEGFEFRIPRLDQRDIDPEIGIPVYFIVAETPHNNPYPFYDLEVTTASYDGTNGPWLLNGKDGVAAVKKVGEDYNDYPDDVWYGFSTETEAKFAHGNTATVWVLEDDIKPGYEFVTWGGVTTQYGNEAQVFMNNDKVATAYFRAKEYWLTIFSNDYGKISLFGDEPELPFDLTTYTVEDPAIQIAGAAIEADDTYEYKLLGFYYDHLYTLPVLDANGQVVLDLDAEEFYAGAVDGVDAYDFFHTTIIPSEIADAGFENMISVYARFAKRQIGYTINLETRIYEDTEYNPAILADTYLALNGVETDSHVFPFEEVVEVATEPVWGFEFKHWKYKDGSLIVPQMTYFHLVDESATLVAVFKPIEYELNVVAEEGGEVAGSGVFTRLDAPVVEVTDVEIGWAFTGWAEVDQLPAGVDPMDMSFVYEVTEDVIDAGEVTFTATFEMLLYNVIFMVSDTDGLPLEGATVTILGEDLAGVTDADGMVVFEDLHGEYDYEVTMDALDAQTGSFDVNIDTVDADGNLIVMVQLGEVSAPTYDPADDVHVTAKTAYITWEGGTAWEVSFDGGAFVPAADASWYSGDLATGTEYVLAVRSIGEGGGVSDVLEIVFSTLELGDVDGNGVIEPTDRTLIIAFMNNMIPADFVIHTADQLVDYDEVGVFIFDAADIDGNGTINILDLVRWVNIFNTNDDDKSMQSDDARVHMDKNIVHLDNDGSLAALQFELIGRNLENVELSMIVTGYELFWNVNGDVLTGFIVSHDNRAFAKGTTELFKIQHTEPLTWGKVFAANLNGVKVDVDVYNIPTGITDDYVSELSVSVFPNPSSGQFTSVVDVPVNSKVTLKLYDLSGREFASKQISASGIEHVSWNEDLNPGMYILRMIAAPEGSTEQSVTREVRVLIN